MKETPNKQTKNTEENNIRILSICFFELMLSDYSIFVMER